MQSLKAKFNGNGQEVVKYAREFGISAAMEEYQVKDYIAMLHFLEKQAPGEAFHVAKVEVNDFVGPDTLDRLLEKMLAKYSAMESVNNAQAARINELEKQVAYYKGMKWQTTRPLVESLMQYCEGK